MGRKAKKALAPFEPEQVESLNAYQRDRMTGKLTCVAGHVFQPRQSGLICPVDSHHSQHWAWDYMADWGWRMDNRPRR